MAKISAITVVLSKQEKEMIRNASRLQSVGKIKSMHEFCRQASVMAAYQVMVGEGDWERYKKKYEGLWGPMNLDFMINNGLQPNGEDALPDDEELEEVMVSESETSDPAFEED